RVGAGAWSAYRKRDRGEMLFRDAFPMPASRFRARECPGLPRPPSHASLDREMAENQSDAALELRGARTVYPRFVRPLLASVAVLLIVTASGETPEDFPEAEFRFTRLQYVDSGLGRGFSFGFGGPSWRVDYPEAEIHFRQAVERLTRLEFGRPGIVHLRDDTLFDYPWLYAVEVGEWYLD